MDKAPDAFRTISEVADELDIPQHVLRFWESRFTQIKPMKRAGGRRYYRPDDVELLRGIRHLLYGEGYTIRGVQRILKEQGVRAVQDFAQQEFAQENGLEEDGAQDDARAEGHAGVQEPVRDGGHETTSARRSSEAPELGHAQSRAPGHVPDHASGIPHAAPAVAPPVALHPHGHAARILPPGLDATQRTQLEAVLETLAACRTMLEAAAIPPGPR